MARRSIDHTISKKSHASSHDGWSRSNQKAVRCCPCEARFATVAYRRKGNERMKASSYLDGQMLIAMPSIGDPRFEHSLIYLCAHSDNGAMGIIVNKRSPMISFADLLDRLEVIPDSERIKL